MIPLIDVPDDLGFTDEHALLRATARRLFADRCPMAEVRRLAGDAMGFDPALVRELGDQGFAGMLVPEALGGAGQGILSMAVVLEEAGRCLLPAPLLATVLAGIAIDAAGSPAQKQRWLPDLAAAAEIGTIALTEPGGSWQPEAVTATARERAGGYVLSGVKTHVAWAHGAPATTVGAPAAEGSVAPRRADAGTVNRPRWMVAPFRLHGDIALFVVDLAAPGVAIEPEVSVDATRRMSRVALADVAVDRGARLEAGDLRAWQRTHVHGYALLAAEMVGAAEAVLVRTRDYAIERVQFDRPIGSFQAVKHPLVDVLIAVESARSLVLGAAAALDAGADQAEILARMAKAAATDALNRAVDRGVQLHGGFGFTWDSDMHFFMKRALWSAATLGDAIHHRQHLAGALLG